MQTGSNLLQGFPIQNIPGLGNVQVIPASSLQALTGQQTISTVSQQSQPVLPPGTQIIGIQRFIDVSQDLGPIIKLS